MAQSSSPPAAVADELPPLPREALLRRVIKALLRLYLVPYHRLELQGGEYLPRRGPALVVINHASLIDVPALMVLDPYPDTATVVKSSMFRLPFVGWILRQWGAIPVEREGRDTGSVRRILEIFRQGRVLAVAAEGRRTRSGHLEAINPVLARISVSSGVAVVPVGIRGSYAALPPGAVLPRPEKILVKVGRPFAFERGTPTDAAAERIRREIAALLPPEMQPVD